MKKEILFLSLLLLTGCAVDDPADSSVSNGSGLIDVYVDLSLTVSVSEAPFTRSVSFTGEGEDPGVRVADSTATESAASATAPAVSATASDRSGLLASATAAVQTKAASAADNTISTLWIGQYDAGGNLLIAHYVTGISGNKVSFQLKESSACSLHVVANAGDLGKIGTLKAFKTRNLTYETAGPSLSPMYGLLENQTVSVTYSPSIKLTPMIAHVQLQYSIAPDFTFEVASVSLHNVPNALRVDPSDIGYTSLSVKTAASTGTYDWYIPENKAGAISSGQEGYATTARGKTGGVSVPNASYLEIGGKAVVNGVTFTNVSYRFYLGKSSDYNDYNVKRNTTYKVKLTLSGIDWSDPRVSATAPMVSPTELEPEQGSTTTLQVTSRPGEPWEMVLPDWLSATVNGTSVDAGGTVSQTGPVSVELAAVTTNPDATPRQKEYSISSGGKAKKVTVTQKASVLTAVVSPTELAVTKDAVGIYTMNGTEGLSYSFTAGFPSWLTITNGTASIDGGTTSGSDQTLTYKTGSVNPNGSERKVTVTVKAGNMTKGVEIKQAASSFSRTNPSEKIAAAGDNQVTGSVTATDGLKWKIAPSTHNGITVSPTSGTGNATIFFTGAANTGAERTGSFTLSATGASPARTLALSVTQEAAEIPATIGNLQVCKTSGGTKIWSRAYALCEGSTAEGKNDWRLPSRAELETMYKNKRSLENTAGFTAFASDWYWTDTAGTGNTGTRCCVNFSNGSFKYYNPSTIMSVRCVRNK